jgi:signal peptidase I
MKSASTKYCFELIILILYVALYLQILNRTNNIFELVTVEPVLTERPSDRKGDIVLLSDETDGLPDDMKLRLKGTKHKYQQFQILLSFLFDLNHIHFSGPPFT